MLNSSDQSYRDQPSPTPVTRPPFRRLRGYAFDPSLSLRLETAAINQVVFQVPWESHLAPGPSGEYVEVVDVDPASGCWYEPIDLNAVEWLAQDGVSPSEGNPAFHQQMVYAVAMNTIANFERALGRQVMWSPRERQGNYAPGTRDEYVQRLRIYPHALRAANAYYSPDKKALLFGYFQGPSGTVFSCLSQDIIAHETTHALLDGMHRRYVEDNHPDTLAFHEAFADLVALFQHFTFPDVLRHQINRTRGNLETQSLLGELAQQFGEATGRYGALRSALGEFGPDGEWMPRRPDPQALRDIVEPHARGSILVAAMFAAFLAIYKSRTRGVVQLASAGTGILPEGSLHPSLVDALANEATKTARHFLHMCIRAIDYCPPFDITFGDYLRALITADYDMVADDKYGYRVALIESFRRWGILPEGLRSLSEENLRWPFARLEYEEGWNALAAMAEQLKKLVSESLFQQDRSEVFQTLADARAQTHEFLRSALHQDGEENQRVHVMQVTGLVLDPSIEIAGLGRKRGGHYTFEVHSVLPTLRVTPSGQIMKQLIVSVTQRLRDVPVDEVEVDAAGGRRRDVAAGEKGDADVFDFRGGATLIFDMEGARPALRYAVTRPLRDTARLERIREHRRKRRLHQFSLRETYFDPRSLGMSEEPFCMLHEDH